MTPKERRKMISMELKLEGVTTEYKYFRAAMKKELRRLHGLILKGRGQDKRAGR